RDVEVEDLKSGWEAQGIVGHRAVGIAAFVRSAVGEQDVAVAVSGVGDSGAEAIQRIGARAVFQGVIQARSIGAAAVDLGGAEVGYSRVSRRGPSQHRGHRYWAESDTHEGGILSTDQSYFNQCPKNAGSVGRGSI